MQSDASKAAPLKHPLCPENYEKNIIPKKKNMKTLFIISTDDAETSYNAMRLANLAVKKGDEVSVFMLGKGVLYEKFSNDQFNVIEQINQFDGDFYV